MNKVARKIIKDELTSPFAPQDVPLVKVCQSEPLCTSDLVCNEVQFQLM